MDKFSILGLITIGIIFASILFAIFLVAVPTTNKLSNRIMALYFAIFSIHMSVFIYANYIEIPLVLDRLRDQIMFLASPLLYLYVLSRVYSDFEIKAKHLLHFLPFLIEVLAYFPRFYLVGRAERLRFYENFNSQFEVHFSAIYGGLVTLIYLILIFWTLRNYRKLLLENYSIQKLFNYKWLYQFFILLTVTYAFSLFKQIYKFYGNEAEVLNSIRIILTLIVLCFMSWIILRSMLQPQLFKGINSKHQLVKKLLENEEIKNDQEKLKKQIQELKHFMESKEPFLDASLSIQNLADQIDVPSKELSLLINHHLNKHFFDFINEYRIKKAIEIFENSKDDKLTVLEVLYRVGFNSKSPFNTAFKKYTGLTPTQYRKTKIS